MNPLVTSALLRRISVVLCAGSLVLFAGGCAMERISYQQPIVSSNAGDTDLLEALDQMDERRKKVASVAVRVQALLQDRRKGREVALNGSYIGDNEGNFRLRLRYNETAVADMCIYKEAVTIWMPRKEKLFKGTREEVRAAGASEIALLMEGCAAHELFFPRAWSPQAVERALLPGGEADQIHVTEKIGLLKRCSRRLLVPRQSAYASCMELHAPAAGPLGLLRYEAYQDASGGLVPYPQKVTVEPVSATWALVLIVEEITFNRTLEASRFDLQLPAEQEAFSLAEALRKRISIWE